VLEEIERQQLVARARHIGELILATMHSLAARNDIIGDVRGRGAMIAAELVRGDGDTTPDPTATARVAQRCHREGLLVLTAGTHGNVLRFLPPLVIPTPLLEEGLTIVEKAFSELQ
jgi:4-aminobutyrate aminotransferase/(S)-3-amino-2-methylpropionate transaminase